MSLADKFNLFDDGFNLLRIVCAVFFIPHLVAKFTVPAVLKFYVDVGFRPAKAWMYFSAVIETFLTVTLFFGIYTRYAAIFAFIHLTCAAAAQYKLTRCWTWVIGGIEYCAFWALCCLAVAIHG